MSKTIVIFGKTHRSACDHLKKILNTLMWKDVEYAAIRNGLYYKANLTNGDVYLTAINEDSFRGFRYDKAYVQDGISEEFVEQVIMPGFVEKAHFEFFSA